MPRKAVDVGDCRVDGCDRKATYKSDRLCQKHYFRVRRYGTTDTTRSGHRKERVITPNGYVRVSDDNHPLASSGYVFEHRKVAYDDRNGIAKCCEMCGRKVTWSTCHVDHIDEDRQNNESCNLRVCCNACNTRRNPRLSSYEHKGCLAVSFNGETKTPAEWERDPRVEVSGSTICRRKKKGESDYDALFRERITHKNHRKSVRNMHREADA